MIFRAQGYLSTGNVFPLQRTGAQWRKYTGLPSPAIDQGTKGEKSRALQGAPEIGPSPSKHTRALCPLGNTHAHIQTRTWLHSARDRLLDMPQEWRQEAWAGSCPRQISPAMGATCLACLESPWGASGPGPTPNAGSIYGNRVAKFLSIPVYLACVPYLTLPLLGWTKLGIR